MTASLVRDNQDIPVRYGWWQSLCELLETYYQAFYYARDDFDDELASQFAEHLKALLSYPDPWFDDQYTPDKTSRQKANDILAFVRNGHFKVIP